MRTIIYVFAGREANMKLQLPFIRRILDEQPHVEYHVWDLARNVSDSAYLRTIEGERITVLTQLAGAKPWERFNEVYNYYAADEFAECLFVKVDDDVVFIQASRWDEFEQVIINNPEYVISAKTINNGACTPTFSGLWEEFRKLHQPLLDVHLSKSYLHLSHSWFFDHWEDLMAEPVLSIVTEDWLSINLIGYDHDMAKVLAGLINTPSPPHIAGRDFGKRCLIGDEGAVNMLPRIILKGFIACHLYFGPQANRMAPTRFNAYRQQYAEIAEKYLR